MPFVRITLTVPNQIVNVEGVRREIIETQNSVTWRKLDELFRRTIRGWKSKPYFTHRRNDTASQLGIFVHPAGVNADKWVLVNEGARPHTIRPRRARMLRFQTGYRAGTRPRVLWSRSYQRFGPYVSKPIVNHPGFEAREFTEKIAEDHEREFIEDMNEAIARGARP